MFSLHKVPLSEKHYSETNRPSDYSPGESYSPLLVMLPAHISNLCAQPAASRICNPPAPLAPQRLSYLTCLPPSIHCSAVTFHSWDDCSRQMWRVVCFHAKTKSRRSLLHCNVRWNKPRMPRVLWTWTKGHCGKKFLPGCQFPFTLPASVYFSPTFSSVSFVFGGGQTAWSLPGVLSSCSVGLWSGCAKTGKE